MEKDIEEMQKLARTLKITQKPVKKYCGKSKVLPDGYSDFDTLYGCLKKGVGVGLHAQKILSNTEITKIAKLLHINSNIFNNRKDLLERILEKIQHINFEYLSNNETDSSSEDSVEDSVEDSAEDRKLKQF